MASVLRKFLPFASLLFIVIYLSIRVPETFLTQDNFLNVLRRSSVNGIIALGMTAVIISGGIDLSVGSLLAFAGMAGAATMLWLRGPEESGPLTAAMMLWGTLAGIAAGALCGLLNGVLITKLRVPPFIVTLGTMSSLRGIAYVMNQGQPYNVPEYNYLGSGTVLGIPVSVVIFALLALLAALLLRHTLLGRYAYAIGANREAVRFSGIDTDRCLLKIYVLSGLLVGIAAMIATSRTVSAQPTAGISLELDVIAAVVIGGASLSGGQGTILGTIIGTLLISFLRNGCTLLGRSTEVQLIIIGAIIVAAVAVDQAVRRKTAAAK